MTEYRDRREPDDEDRAELAELLGADMTRRLLYCSTYCEHNAGPEWCQCEPCVWIRAHGGFQHADGCTYGEERTIGE